MPSLLKCLSAFLRILLVHSSYLKLDTRISAIVFLQQLCTLSPCVFMPCHMLLPSSDKHKYTFFLKHIDCVSMHFNTSNANFISIVLIDISTHHFVPWSVFSLFTQTMITNGLDPTCDLVFATDQSNSHPQLINCRASTSATHIP